MTDFAEARDGVARTPDWTAWGAPRVAERGVETAFHHPLILLRARGLDTLRVVSPGDVVVGGAAELEWSPMPWALRGRRLWRSVAGLGPGKVFAGDGDRLFMMGDAACEQLFEGSGLGARGVESWIEMMKRRLGYCDARGIVYRLLIIPDNPAVHSEAIAGAPKLAPDRPAMKVLRHGGEALREHLVYPLDAMIAGLAKAEVCLPHDVHISGYGSFVVYRELMATLPGVDPAGIAREADLQTREIFVAGDIARSVGEPGRRVELLEPPPPKFKAVVRGTSYRSNQVDVFQSEDAHLPKAVMFRTSNSSRLMVYLMRHFSRLVAVATTHMYYDLLESERPDVVISEMPERYFAMHQQGLDETERAVVWADPEREFEARTGHTLPLPRE